MADDLIESLLRRSEAKDLDFKGPMAWSPTDKAACCGLVKDIIAMANTLGGRIVIGVAETATGPDPVGLDLTQSRSWETTKLNQFVRRYADFPINTTLLKRQYEGKHSVVIEVPAFTDMPHICKADFPGVLGRAAIYVRTDSNESAPVDSAADLQVVIERAVRNRSARIIEAIRAVLVGAAVTPQPSDVERFEEQVDEAVARFSEGES